MNRSMKVVWLSALAGLFMACTVVHDQGRVEPLLYLPQEREISLTIRATNHAPAPSVAAMCTGSARRSSRCDHVSVRLDGLLAASAFTAAERDPVVELLLNVSDYNCAAFLSRAFGRKGALGAANGVLQHVNSALNARSQKNASLSTALQVLQLAGNSASAIDDQRFALGSAETSVEIAIIAERGRLRNRMARRSREDAEPYPLLAALSDVGAYDETCSLRRGAELLAESGREQELKALKELLQRLQPAGQIAPALPASATLPSLTPPPTNTAAATPPPIQ